MGWTEAVRGVDWIKEAAAVAEKKLWMVCMGMEMEESWEGLASRRDGIELVETDMRFCLKSWIGEIDRGFSKSGLYEE